MKFGNDLMGTRFSSLLNQTSLKVNVSSCSTPQRGHARAYSNLQQSSSLQPSYWATCMAASTAGKVLRARVHAYSTSVI